MTTTPPTMNITEAADTLKIHPHSMEKIIRAGHTSQQAAWAAHCGLCCAMARQWQPLPVLKVSPTNPFIGR